MIVLYSVAIRSLSHSFCMLARCKHHEGWEQNKVVLCIGSQHHIQSTKQAPTMKLTLANHKHSHQKRRFLWGLPDLHKSKFLIMTQQLRARRPLANLQVAVAATTQHDFSSQWPLPLPRLDYPPQLSIFYITSQLQHHPATSLHQCQHYHLGRHDLIQWLTIQLQYYPTTSPYCCCCWHLGKYQPCQSETTSAYPTCYKAFPLQSSPWTCSIEQAYQPTKSTHNHDVDQPTLASTIACDLDQTSTRNRSTPGECQDGVRQSAQEIDFFTYFSTSL